MKILIVTIKDWNIKKARITNHMLITGKEDLTYDKVKKIEPDYIFFLHWSWKIPKEIYGNFKCILFHMTDLPYGRGGSPLQNLILRGNKSTKISAIEVVDELDAGKVYLKRDLSLAGSAQEIFNRAADIMFEMIDYIVRHNPAPSEQNGAVVTFKRRRPEQSNMQDISNAYDHIRMLDADSYPRAYLNTKYLNIEFSNAQEKDDYIEAVVQIRRLK